jgi:hypothetical protein
MSDRLKPDEQVKFAFCESVHAGGGSPWHIRPIKTILKPGGGIDTSSFCGHVRPNVGGWDILVRITGHHLTHACPACVAEYQKVKA